MTNYIRTYLVHIIENPKIFIYVYKLGGGVMLIKVNFKRLIGLRTRQVIEVESGADGSVSGDYNVFEEVWHGLHQLGQLKSAVDLPYF